MFTFTNTVVINSSFDELSKLAKFDNKENVFRVKRVGNFDKASVKSVYKRLGYLGVISTATFTMPEAPSSPGDEDFYRIELFMKLSGNQTSTMATATSVYKSKPIHIEFKVANGESASDIADNLVKAVKFFQQNLYPFIKAEKDAHNKVIISGTDEYEVFGKAQLQKLTSVTPSVYPDDQNVYKKVSDAVIANGKEGFGTYMNIMKNLRLPTMENLRFNSPNQEEMPVMGALYNQYTLEYCKDRGILGSDAVGDQVTSVTHHVFFVKQDLAASFEATMKAAGLTITDITEGIIPIKLEVSAGQSVEKGSKAVLKYKVNGNEQVAGATWKVSGGSGLTITDGNVINATGVATGPGNLTVTFNGKTATGTIAVTGA